MTHARERRTDKVRVAPLTADDLSGLRRAMAASQTRVGVWGPTGLDSVDDLLAVQGRSKRTFIVHALTPDPGADHDIAALINVNDIVMGRFASATLGYDAYDPYAGRGLTRDGLALVLDVCFAPPPDGLGLHRVEASVQPTNVRSAGLLRSVGFVREGFSSRLLRLPSLGDKEVDWRDHDRYALLSEDWPGAAESARIAYRAAPVRPVVCLINGLPGSGKSTLAPRLAAELGVPLLGKDLIKEAVADALDESDQGRLSKELGSGASRALWALLATSPAGAVVESWLPPTRDTAYLVDGLRAAGLDPTAVPEVFCDVPPEVARERDRLRAAKAERHPVHRGAVGEGEWRESVAPAAYPVGVGPVLRVDTSQPVTDAQVCRLALAIRAAATPTGSRYSAVI